MENPKCPYCGEEQYLTIEDHREIGRMEYYMCIHCGSRSPVKTTTEEAYAAAMKRDRAKGEWTYGDGETLWTCSVCGNDSCCKGNFCPECGAEMREDEDDE